MKKYELLKLLESLPDNAEIVISQHSDYGTKFSITRIKAVPQTGGWVMRSHRTMSEENRSKEKDYYAIEGEY